jgi:nitroreductase
MERWSDMNEVINVIRKRRTVRSFQKKNVERALLEKIVEAARYAPSGMNCQSFCFVVVTGGALEKLRIQVRDYFRALELTPEMPPFFGICKENAKEDEWSFFYGAPALLVVANKKGYRNAMADSAAATMNAMLAAEALGLSSGWITTLSGNTNQPAVRNALSEIGIPEDYDVFTSMTIGYGNGNSEASPRTSLVIWKD